MRLQAWLWGAAGAAVALGVLAGIADSRRHRRASFDGHGWVPWRGLQVACVFASVALAVFAVKAS